MIKNHPKGLTLKIRCHFSEWEGGSAEVVNNNSLDAFREVSPLVRLEAIKDALRDLEREQVLASIAILAGGYRGGTAPSYHLVLRNVRERHPAVAVEDEEILFEFSLWSGLDLLRAYEEDRSRQTEPQNVIQFPA